MPQKNLTDIEFEARIKSINYLANKANWSNDNLENAIETLSESIKEITKTLRLLFLLLIKKS